VPRATAASADRRNAGTTVYRRHALGYRCDIPAWGKRCSADVTKVAEYHVEMPCDMEIYARSRISPWSITCIACRPG